MLRVEVAYAPQARAVDCVTLQLASGSCVADAVQASGLLARHGLVLAMGAGGAGDLRAARCRGGVASPPSGLGPSTHLPHGPSGCDGSASASA